MKQLSKKILEAINTGIRMGLSLDNFDDTDDKLPTLKKDIKSKSENNYIKAQQLIIQDQLENLDFDDNIIDKINEYHFIWKPTDNEKFKNAIRKYIHVASRKCDLNWIDTSEITDMSYLFSNSEFNGDISKWNVSNVKDMEAMFEWSKFNGDISKWNVSNVENMYCMFMGGVFNKNISKWDVSNVRNMSAMFERNKKFNQNISNWDVSKVEKYQSMFSNCNIKSEYMPIQLIKKFL